jgi:tetratricopeptide (TPR) repeat protein
MAKRSNRKQDKADDLLVDLIEVQGQAKSLFEQYQTYILGGVAALVIVVGGWFAYTYLYMAPKQKEAVEQMYRAQLQFERDSFALALTNPAPGFSGFLDIIDNYKGTKAANAANYYAGICYLHLGSYDAALDYLKSFSPDGEVLPIMKYGAMGDAYSELQDFSRALSNYERAVKAGDNDFLVAYYLKKIGMLHEHNGDMAKARKSYEQIKSDYPLTPAGSDIEKYLSRVQ